MGSSEVTSTGRRVLMSQRVRRPVSLVLVGRMSHCSAGE